MGISSSQLLHFQIPCQCASESNRSWPKYLSPAIKAGNHKKLLTLSWANADHCHHLGREPVSQRSLCNSTFQTNLKKQNNNKKVESFTLKFHVTKVKIHCSILTFLETELETKQSIFSNRADSVWHENAPSAINSKQKR